MSPRNRIAITAIATAIAIVLLHGAAPVSAQQQPLKTWSKTIPKGAQRFKVLSGFGDQAVLDQETGLVWERTPDPTETSWAIAFATCINRTTGGRKGWRLPTIAELSSLLDATSGLAVLPAGHPFTVDDAFFWSATSNVSPEDALFLGGSAWALLSPLTFGHANPLNKLSTNEHHVWCVRGGGDQDPGPRGSVDH